MTTPREIVTQLQNEAVDFPMVNVLRCSCCGKQWNADEEEKHDITCPSGKTYLLLYQENPWTTLGELPPGTVFETMDGIRAVKSEYYYDPPRGANPLPTQCECVLLASGEYAHFPNKNSTSVRKVHVL
jgi:hypothetical protein